MKRKEAGIIGEVFNTGNPVFLKNPYEDKRFNLQLDHKLKQITKNLLAVPIKFAEHSIGVLEVANKQTQSEYSDTDLLLVK